MIRLRFFIKGLWLYFQRRDQIVARPGQQSNFHKTPSSPTEPVITKAEGEEKKKGG